MGLVVASGAAVPLAGAGQAAVPPVPIVALVNHSASSDALFLGQFCGGVATSTVQVITAAHCVEDRSPATVDVVAGVSDLCAREVPSTLRRSAVVAIDPVVPSGGTLVRLVLQRPIEVPASPRPDPWSPPVVPGTAIAGWGWGRDAEAGVPSCELRRVGLVVVDPERCEYIASATFTRASDSGGAAYICAVPDADRNTCNGDSGGPVTVVDETTGRPRVIAVTMTGVGCGPGSLGLSVLLEVENQAR